ncbi:enterotoxin A family protein [Serratia liquefaciens]|uniref:enterotoxin A family protein n=1 Tax=Serratia liquefaciens TaxID=614 RepID=UPI003807D749
MRDLFLYLFLSVLSVQCFAEQTYVYRADTRYLSDIKNKGGFISPGDNKDILSHADGISCYAAGEQMITEGSRFISTSMSRDFAIDWGRELASQTPHGYVLYYVYEIRPEQNMYRLIESLNDWIRHFKLNPVYNNDAIIAALERATSRYEDQQEVIADRLINFNQIRQVWVYRIGPDTNDEPVFIRNEINPDYIDAATNINPSPYMQYVVPNLSNSQSVTLSSCDSCLSLLSSQSRRKIGSNIRVGENLPKKIAHCRLLFNYLFFQ